MTKDIEITASENNNSIKGGTGNDTLISGGGNDILVGNKGSDTFIFTAEGNTKIADYHSMVDTIIIDGEIDSTSTSNKDLIFNVDDK